MTFNKAEMAISINIRSLPQEAITLTTFTEITETTEIIENIPNASDADIANANDTNTTLENIENAPLESITVEPAPVRRSTRHKKATFKAVGANAVGANTMEANAVGAAETPTTPADEEESEKENYLPKIIIVKLTIINEDKLTYEEAIADLKKF
jgi:hypothetical protein